MKLYYIECSTGCTCCSNENFTQGFYLTKELADDEVAKYKLGIGNPLASQYAKYGRYRVVEVEAEELEDGRVVVNYDGDEGYIYSSTEYFSKNLDFYI